MKGRGSGRLPALLMRMLTGRLYSWRAFSSGRSDGSLIRDIGLHRDGAPAIGLKRGAKIFGRCRAIAIVDGDHRAGLRERRGDGRSQAPRAAADKRNALGDRQILRAAGALRAP